MAKRLNRTHYILVDIQKIVSYEYAHRILKLARLSRQRNAFSVARLNISTHNGKKSILRDKSPSNFSRYSLVLSGIRSIFTGRELSSLPFWLPFVRGNNHFLDSRKESRATISRIDFCCFRFHLLRRRNAPSSSTKINRYSIGIRSSRGSSTVVPRNNETAYGRIDSGFVGNRNRELKTVAEHAADSVTLKTRQVNLADKATEDPYKRDDETQRWSSDACASRMTTR